MAELKFYRADGAVDTSAETRQDYDSAPVFDKVRVGTLGVYYKEGFRIRMVPFTYPDRAFIRVQEVNARISCCSNSLFYCKLMFVKDGKEFGNIMSEKEPEMDKALAMISANAPQIAIGYPRPDTEA